MDETTQDSPQGNKKKAKKIKTSFLGRTLSTAKLSTRLGLGAAKKLLNTKDMDPEKAVDIAVKLANEFDGMKGLMMKFGQMASYLGTHMPPEARAALAKLQSSSTAMEFPVVKDIIERELGAPIEELFDHFEETAFAAASIGQVHRATINGRAVAVKIQYPDIEKLISMDLSLVGNLFTFLTMGSAFKGKDLAQELSDRILEECDYEREAHSQTKIRELWQQYPDTHIPEVIKSHCSKRVFTSEFIQALDFQTFCQTANQEAKNKAGLIIFRNTMDAIFKYCFFNGDPHPGNYLFFENGDVIFLDFGCIKRFDTTPIVRWKAMAKSILENNKTANWDATLKMGLIGNPKKFNHDFHWEMMNHVYEPLKAKTPYSYSHDHNRRTNEYMLWENKNTFSANMPPDFLFINRLQWGLAAVLADLDATSIWNTTFTEAVYAPPTPLFENH